MTSHDNLEEKVVGAVLSNPSFYPRAAFIQADAFSSPTLSTVWRLIERAVSSGKQPSRDVISVVFRKELEKIGGTSLIDRLCFAGDRVVTTFNEAVDALHEDMQWRRINAIAIRLQSAASSRDKTPDQILSGLIGLGQTFLGGGRDSFQSKKTVARRAIDLSRTPRATVTTGIDMLDFVMQGGLRERRLYCLAGEFGRGKTVLAGTISDNLNLQDTPHLFLSLEMSPEDIEVRSCARHLNLNAAHIYDSGDSHHQEFLRAADTYLDALPDHVLYDFCPAATIDELHRKILAAKAKYGIKGFILDYFQLIKGRERGQSEDAHLRDCADRLAAICRQEDLWGLVTAQVDERGRIKLTDALYHSAALVMRLVRDETQSEAYFVTDKSNYTRYEDTGNESVPGMIFDQEIGPHFRNTEATDIGETEPEPGNINL